MSRFRGRVRARRDASARSMTRRSIDTASGMRHRGAPVWLEPFGQPREAAACGVASLCHGTTMAQLRAWHSTTFRGCAAPKPTHKTL